MSKRKELIAIINEAMDYNMAAGEELDKILAALMEPSEEMLEPIADYEDQAVRDVFIDGWKAALKAV